MGGCILLILVFLLMIVCHPGTQMLVKHIKEKKKSKEIKCYHTSTDCDECMSSRNCPIKYENLITKHDR